MEPDQKRTASIAQHIRSRAAMAQGVMVLDQTLGILGPALREANIKVVELSAEMSDESIKDGLLAHRVIVTSSPADFIDDAPVYEYGIIALDKLKRIDPAPTYRANTTVQLISKAMSRYKLWVKGAKFLLELRDDGRHTLEDLS